MRSPIFGSGISPLLLYQQIVALLLKSKFFKVTAHALGKQPAIIKRTWPLGYISKADYIIPISTCMNSQISTYSPLIENNHTVKTKKYGK